MPAKKSRAQQRRRSSAPARRPRPTAPAARPARGAPPARFVAAGVVVSGALVALLAAGLGAAIVTAGVLAAGWYVGGEIVAAARGERPLAAAQKGVVLALVFLLPIVLDPRSADIFATVKFSVLAAGGVVVAALFLADVVVAQRWRRWRRPTALHWMVVAFVVWAAVSTFASGHVAFSTLGDYSSNNGLVTVVALAVLFVSAAAVFRRTDIERLAQVLFFGAGGVVVGFAVVQLLDRALPGPALDPVNWPSRSGLSALRTSGVWSTLGNPNHVGGFCAIVLPVGVAIVATTASRAKRVGALVLLAGALVVIVQTSSRGAWLASAMSLAAIAVLERRRLSSLVRGRVAPVVGVGVAGAAAAVATSLNSGLLAKGADQLFQIGGTGTIAQRLQFWRTTLTMSSDRPLVGFGLDGYRLSWPHYVRPRFISTWGYELTVTGPHNTFLNALYAGGWPLLVLFVAVVVAGAVACVASVRRLRGAGVDGGGEDAQRGADASLLAALGIGAAAYLVVASFNVERLELAAVFWVILGIVVAVGRADAPAPSGSSTARAWSTRRPGIDAGSVARIAVGAVLVVAAIVGVVTATRPWRADRDLAAVQRLSRTDVGNDRLARQQRSDRTLAHLRRALRTNPWEARYQREYADQLRGAGIGGAKGDEQQKGRAVTAFEDSLEHYESAASFTPNDPYLVSTAADVRFRLSSLLPGAADSLRTTSFAELRALLRWAPHAGDIRAYYATRLAVHGRGDEAIRQIEAALREFPDADAVLQGADRVYRALGEPAKAKRYADRRAALDKQSRSSGSTTTTTTTTTPIGR